MANYVTTVEQLIGNTPLIELKRVEEKFALKARLFAKLESFNPGGSAKDRVGLAMIEAAEKDGTLKPGATIIEPTSGNTGIGLAAVAAAKGYKTVIVMPDSMSAERILTMKAYGAEVILTDGKKGMSGCIAKAEELKKQIIHPEIIKEVAKDIKIVYSPFHGTGNVPVRRILKELGFEKLSIFSLL